MPLATGSDTGRDASVPVAGLPLHTRSLTVSVKRSSDDQWLVRGDVIDLRKNGFVPTSYDLQPSGIIHSMNIELDLDPESLRMNAIRVDQPFVAVEPSESTKGECCRDPAPRLFDLTGECLDDDFQKKLGGVFAGPLGCSHLLTLFQLMASTVPRAAELERARFARDGTEQALGNRFYRRSIFVDGLQASKDVTDVSVQLADTMTRPIGPETKSVARLELSHEVKTFASISRKRFEIERLAIRERKRNAETLITSEWNDHSDHFAELVGTPLIPGLAKRIFSLTKDDPAFRAVQDNLLMFAPGFVQVLAALMEAYSEERAREAATAGSAPDISSIGGNTDSCYMWRRGGAIEKARFETKAD